MPPWAVLVERLQAVGACLATTVRWRGTGRTLGRMAALEGKVMIFPEPDYQYGLGPLRLRVERVDRTHPAHYDGEKWYPVEGVQLDAAGHELGRRNILVRGRRLLP